LQKLGEQVNNLNSHLVWLSHALEPNTPCYGGGAGISVSSGKSMASGDSCNTSLLSFPNHIGSHVDAPRHFISDGSSINDYQPEDWLFTCPLMIMDVPTKAGQLLGPDDVPKPDYQNDNVDLLLIRTGFEVYRDQDVYWREGPGLHPNLAGHFRIMFPSLQAIGLDTISISSFQHRDAGREAHKTFLSDNIRIFEDLSLAHVRDSRSLSQVIALPLRFSSCDGAPCTILGWERTG